MDCGRYETARGNVRRRSRRLTDTEVRAAVKREDEAAEAEWLREGPCDPWQDDIALRLTRA